MKRLAVLLYGVVSYSVFFGTFLYLIGFVGNLFVPKSIDGNPAVPLPQAILTNIGLVLLFGLQHSIMARQGFKRWWTKFVPKPIERSTFMLFTCLALITLFVFWQPLGGVVWVIENGFAKGVLAASFALGWVVILVSTFLINHFDLFGLRQTWFYFRGQDYRNLPFKTPVLYRFVRHPLYFGFLLAFWSAPVMTVTHLLFSVSITAYILFAIRLEEKDLISFYGEKYRAYRNIVPMIIPFFFKGTAKGPAYQTILKSTAQDEPNEAFL
ncbi:MAG TPA: isoprenylcysteine carboxylmethyltransferase family protein [Flavilitoribacter sp.]|nr:isoprenylcysteine carboxylmethyltransferase family protein [Flavilitoribacter sp.]HMQ87208.1 isoprenylcysteine carboxylmethyltransferase family protein [Flavilitoribacter sp.]